MIDRDTGVPNLFRAPDARSLPPRARVELRREVVAAVHGGLTQLEAARRFGVSRRTVGIWTRAYQPVLPEVGCEHPEPDPPAPGPILTGDQERTLLRLMRFADPGQLGLDGRLWTRRSLAEIVRIETGQSLPAATIDHYLSRWQLACAPVTDGPGALFLSWHRITPPDVRSTVRSSSPAQTWPVLVAESGHGTIHFRLSSTAIGFAEVRAFGRHLTQQHPRPVRLSVWRWPRSQLEILHSWRADPGPGLSITVGTSGDLQAFPESGEDVAETPDHCQEGPVARRGHPADFRRKVLNRVEAGSSVAAVAAELGLSPQTIYAWRRQDRIDRGMAGGLAGSVQAELIAARSRIAQLESELAMHRREAERFDEVVPSH